MINQRWGLQRNDVLWQTEIPGVSNVTEIPEQAETVSRTLKDQSTDKTNYGPNQLN